MKKIYAVCFSIIIVLSLTSAICNNSTPSKPKTKIVQLDVPYHGQTYIQTCQSACAWMYIEYQGNQHGFYQNLPSDPEFTFYNYLSENNWLRWSANGEYSSGINDLMWNFINVNTKNYTTMYLGVDNDFDEMVRIQSLRIDESEPSIVMFEWKEPEIKQHAVVLVGYERNLSTNKIMNFIHHDPLSGGEDQYMSESEWKLYTGALGNNNSTVRLFVSKRG